MILSVDSYCAFVLVHVGFDGCISLVSFFSLGNYVDGRPFGNADCFVSSWMMVGFVCSFRLFSFNGSRFVSLSISYLAFGFDVG